jgi:hypothetical protein
MGKATQMRHVFCLEGFREKDRQGMSSVQPIFELVHHLYKARLKYGYRYCSTPGELEDSLRQWANGYKEYPLLYLAFPVSGQDLLLENEMFPLHRLSRVLKNKCRNRMVIFGSGTAFDREGRHLERFVEETGCLAACSYRADVSWNNPASFELALMDVIQNNDFSVRGIDALAKKMIDAALGFPDLDFHIAPCRSTA